MAGYIIQSNADFGGHAWGKKSVLTFWKMCDANACDGQASIWGRNLIQSEL